MSSKSLSFQAAGGTQEVTFTAPEAWEVTVSDNWVTLSPKGGQAGDVSLSVTALANTTTSTRSTRIYLVIPEKNISETILVSQEAGKEPTVDPDPDPDPEPDPDPVISLSLTEYSFVSQGGTVSFMLDTNVSWSLVSKPEWITVTPSDGEAGAVTLTVIAAANPEYEARAGSLVFAAGTVSATLVVKQDASEPDPDGDVDSDLENPGEGDPWEW